MKTQIQIDEIDYLIAMGYSVKKEFSKEPYSDVVVLEKENYNDLSVDSEGRVFELNWFD